MRISPRNRTAALLAVLFLVLAGLRAPVTAQQVNPSGGAPHFFPTQSWEGVAAPETVGYDSQRLKAVEEYVRTLNTTGLLVVVGGRVLVEYGDTRQLSYLASVRKSILAMLFGNYVTSGTIDLHRTLRDLGMTDHGGLLPIEEEATVEHLLTARSGVYHPASNTGDDTAFAPPRGSQRPGTYFLYNNWDFNAAGAAFERMTGKNIYDALELDLARPIRMEDFDRSRQRKSGNMQISMYPAYHMWLSTRDMARLGYLMLREGAWAEQQIIPTEWARRIVSAVTPVGEMNPPSRRRGPFGYGYMWWVYDGSHATGPYRGAYTALGAYGQFITVLPVLDMVVAHKTAVPPERAVSWDQYQGILNRLVQARM